MATKSKKKKASPSKTTTDYGKAKEIIDSLALHGEVIAKGYDNKIFFQSYLRLLAKLSQKQIISREVPEGVKVIRIS